ncbi:MAG: J domain-containing protein [Treponemataceae bacterium]|nr:J domain-containing protein [Treponemataceae bacterium]
MPSPYDKLGDLLNKMLESGCPPDSAAPRAADGGTRGTATNGADGSTEAEAEARAESLPKSEAGRKEVPGKGLKKDAKSAKYGYKIIHYSDILNIPPGSGVQAVKAAYRAQLKKYHPDAVPALNYMQRTASEKTKEIVEAYRFLLEAAKKDGLP